MNEETNFKVTYSSNRYKRCAIFYGHYFNVRGNILRLRRRDQTGSDVEMRDEVHVIMRNRDVVFLSCYILLVTTSIRGGSLLRFGVEIKSEVMSRCVRLGMFATRST